MTGKRYSIDLHENNRTGRILRIILGIACLVVAVWYMYSIRDTSASVTTAWIASGFLMLFSLWMIVSGLGYTQRYITVAEDKITLRQEFYRPPQVFTPSSLMAVRFRTLVIDFITEGRKVSLRLGTYYPDHTASIIEAVGGFCRHHGIEIIDEEENVAAPGS